jgi:hypothetical protein
MRNQKSMLLLFVLLLLVSMVLLVVVVLLLTAIIVSPDSTVADIKRSFQTIISSQEEKNLASRKISWFEYSGKFEN